MQLWRMKHDGSNSEQLTFDINYKDWFSHLSPDGTWVTLISFLPKINFGDHPFYKQCVLHLIPADGDRPKIIAYQERLTYQVGLKTVNVLLINSN